MRGLPAQLWDGRLGLTLAVIVVTGTDTRNLDDPGEFTFVFRKPVSTETLGRAIDAALLERG